MPRHILVVEDEKTISELLARILTLPRYAVVRVSSAEEARQNLFPLPHLIILDLGLTGESGEDFCHDLHRNPLTRHVPILILTGRDTPDLVDSSMASCAQEIAHKPIDKDELVYHVESILKKAAYELHHFPAARAVSPG